MTATAAKHDRRPLLRLARTPSAVGRMAPAVVREFGRTGAAAQLRAARLLLGPGAEADDATAAALALVQLALDDVEATVAELPGRALAMLDAVRDEYRAALRRYMKEQNHRVRRAFDAGRRRGRADVTQPVDRVTTERGPAGVGSAAESRAAEVLRPTNDPGRSGLK